MKQKFTLTAAILTLIEFVCLCVPFSLVEVIYYRSSNGIGHTPTYFNNTNIFGNCCCVEYDTNDTNQED